MTSQRLNDDFSGSRSAPNQERGCSSAEDIKASADEKMDVMKVSCHTAALKSLRRKKWEHVLA